MIVTIHRIGLEERSSWTDRTTPKNLEPFKLSSAARPLYWARRQRVASRKLLVSIVCKMTSSLVNAISQILTGLCVFPNAPRATTRKRIRRTKALASKLHPDATKSTQNAADGVTSDPQKKRRHRDLKRPILDRRLAGSCRGAHSTEGFP
jgi:hypothetical protein